MSYIVPDSTIYLCSDVPLDPSYSHTIYWSSSSKQLAYFKGKAKKSLTDYTYQRVQKGVLRCQVLADNIYDVNYMIFQNSAYGSRWFYCFVTAVEYVNDVTSDVYFEIDVLQTWHFDYDLKQCWIDRQHTTTDYIGEHIEPEPLNCVEYGYVEIPEATGFSNNIIVAAICDVDGSAAGSIINNNFSGCELYVFSLDEEGADALNTLIDSYSEAEDSIVSIYLCPQYNFAFTDINSGSPIDFKSSGEGNVFTYDYLTSSSKVGWIKSNTGGYKPRNCKLLTYPYTYFSVSDANGGSLTLPYEFFLDGQPTIATATTITNPVEVICFPTRYKGSGEDNFYTDYEIARYYPEALTLTDFPVCSWNYDAYKAWYAQNATPIAINSLGSLSNATISALSGNVGGAASNLISTTTSLASQFYSASIAADVCRGSFSNGGANSAVKQKDFYCGRMSIDYYTAQRYDTFFDMYGYAVNHLATPNRKARTYWTYLKTTGCNIEGSVPAQDAKAICALYDRGLTWWNGAYPSNILNYSSDNRASSRGRNS